MYVKDQKSAFFSPVYSLTRIDHFLLDKIHQIESDGSTKSKNSQ